MDNNKIKLSNNQFSSEHDAVFKTAFVKNMIGAVLIVEEYKFKY